MEALKLIGNFASGRLPGRVLVQHLVTNQSSYHKIIRMPWCEVCGGAARNGTHGLSREGRTSGT